uniref:Odorant receptor n=1 Tax=Leucinodes orbonalis TaxID=711050 RepID=A0AAU0QLL0_9NEOP|nr:odorant receptor [Leucinodes orbonalis]
MEMDNFENVSPFDAFKLVIKVLIWTGIYEVNTQRKTIRTAHYVYRILVIFIAVLSLTQHGIRMYQMRDVREELFLALIKGIPVFTLIIKEINIFRYILRINKLHEQIKDSKCMPSNEKDADYLLKNNKFMYTLTKISMLMMFVGFSSFVVFMFIRRYLDPKVQLPSYMPFSTDSMVGFCVAIILDLIIGTWTGFGQYASDLVIATYYAHATVQLKILKYNLISVFGVDKVESNMTIIGNHFQYKDVLDPNLKQRFGYYAEKYRMLICFVQDVDAIFNWHMSIQFFTASANLCFVSSIFSTVKILSSDFVFSTIVALLSASQVFLYCYFGHQVRYESESMNTAIYSSDWMSVSPSLRRDVFTAMTAWHRPISSQVSYIVPVSLVTFVSIMRFAYSLYTLMKAV